MAVDPLKIRLFSVLIASLDSASPRSFESVAQRTPRTSFHASHQNSTPQARWQNFHIRVSSGASPPDREKKAANSLGFGPSYSALQGGPASPANDGRTCGWLHVRQPGLGFGVCWSPWWL